MSKKTNIYNISAFSFFVCSSPFFSFSFWTHLFSLDECTNQVVAPVVVATTSRTSSTTYCTPMRGRMTAYLPSAISAYELGQKEMELLSYIESDMSFYTNEDISKVIYIGSRPTTSTISTNGSSANSVGGVIVGNNAAVVTPSGSGSPSSNSTGKSGISLLIGGIVLSIVSIALIIIMLVVYKRRRCRNSRDYQFENDINGGGGGGGGGRDVLSRYPDDIQLLPNPDKLDLRSVHSKDSILSDADTENYSYVDDEGEEVDYIDRAIDYMDDAITKGGSNTNIRSSELAALGMASTLVTARSYMSPKSYDEEAYYEYENDVEEVEAENDLDDGLVDTDNDHDGNGNDNGVEVEDIVDEEEETSLPHLGTVIELDNFSTMSSKEESMSSREEYYTLP